MKQTRCEKLIGNARRELLRIALEKVQGRTVQRAIDDIQDIEDDSSAKYEVEEKLNNPYMNRSEVPLAMDIFKPVVDDKEELPVIVTIHGGGLVLGDRKMSRKFAKTLAGRGYLVFSIEYRLAPRANSSEQLDDICAGMDLIGRELVDYNVDFGRMFLVAESAGAFLAIYVAAMKGSEKLQKAIGYEPTRMRFSALGLISGMFYTNRPDPIGLLLSEQFYGDKRMDKKFLKYTDPEHSEIVNNLPPSFFITSRGDFLNNYTLMYHKKLKKSGIKTKLIYYGKKKLGHAFVTMKPWLEESQDAIDKMVAWFEEQAELRAANIRANAETEIKAETNTDSETDTKTEKKTVTKTRTSTKSKASGTRKTKGSTNATKADVNIKGGNENDSENV